MTSWERTAEGLLVANVNGFADKAAVFAAAGATGMHAIFDFDRTLTVKRPGSNDEVTTWHILCDHLPSEGQRRYHELFAANRPLEMSGQMTNDDAVRWWSSILNLFVEYGVDLAAVEETFLERASIRPGTAELFGALAEYDIPTIILSAGIREVIDLWFRHYDIAPALVVSTKLELHGRKIAGWQKDTLVHVLNKSEASHPELAAIRAARPNALVVGDGLDDANMAAGDANVIRVRILDSRADETATAEETHRTFERFDALIQNGSLRPMVELVRRLA